jgi:hypothetical protein
VPVLEQVRLSARYAAVQSGHGFGGIPLTALWAIVCPNGFGNPLRHNFAWVVNYPTVAISYAGLLPLALFIASAFSPRTKVRDRVLVVIAFVLFLVAMDWSILGHLINAIPPFSIVANDKLRFVSIFLVAVVAAKSLDRSRALVIAAAVPLVLLVAYAYATHPLVMRPADLAGGASIALFLCIPRRYAAVAIAAELFVLNTGFNALVDGRYFCPPLPIVAALRAHAPAEPFRVVGRDWVLLPNASAQYGLEDIRGSDPMEFESYDRFLRRFTVQEEGTWVRRVVDVNRDELDFLNVRFLLAEPDGSFGGRWRLLYRGGDGSLFENASVLPRFFGRGGAEVLRIEQLDPMHFRLKVRASWPATIASSQPAPGWRVRVNDHRTKPHAIDGIFLSFAVPAGASSVDIMYRPLSYYGSLVIAVLALLFLMATKIAHPYKSHRGSASSATSGRSGFGAAASANHHGNSRDQMV